MFVVSRHFECISCICITIEFGCYLKVHLDQFCIEYPTQFETQIGPGVKMSLNWRWFFGTLPLHVELAKILVVHSQKKGMRLSRKLPKSKPKKMIIFRSTKKVDQIWWTSTKNDHLKIRFTKSRSYLIKINNLTVWDRKKVSSFFTYFVPNPIRKNPACWECEHEIWWGSSEDPQD